MSYADIPLEFGRSLYGLNSFGIRAKAACVATITDPAQLSLLQYQSSIPKPLRMLGGGSNVLITSDIEGTVVLNRIKGMSVIREDHECVWLRAGAGEVWHELVMFTIEQGWGGIENLALIPGTVGAAPIQNIGAYGVEVKDTIVDVETWDREAGAMRTFSNQDCRFGYRDSVFKHEWKDRVFVTAVVFRLLKKPVLHTSYGAIAEELKDMGVDTSVRTVAQAVINIRQSKLPDPAVIGNAGSFFKNPVIPLVQYQSLLSNYPLMPAYPSGDRQVKVPAGWLIEQCGWKGFRKGDVGVHAKQALVIVNYGHADGASLWQLSSDVLQSVQARFGILLEREVQVW